MANPTHVNNNSRLSIASFNVKDVCANILAVQEVLKGVDLLAIQEHWLFNFEQQKLHNIDTKFVAAAKSVDDDNLVSPFQKPRGYGGVAFLWKKSIDNNITLLPDGSERVICLELNTDPTPCCLINGYLPCRGSYSNDDYKATLDEIEEIILKYCDTHMILIMGDLNASLTKKPPSSRDNLLIEFCRENDLMTDVPVADTFFHVNGVDSSQIDYFLTLRRDRHRLTYLDTPDAIDPVNVSDHAPIYAFINANFHKRKLRKRLTNAPVLDLASCKTNWTKIDKCRYRELTNDNMVTQKITNKDELLSVINNLTDTLTNASQECCGRPRKHKKSTKGLNVWNSRISSLAKHSKAVHLQWKNAGRPGKDSPIAAERKTTKRRLRAEVRRACRDRDDQHRDDIMKARSVDTKLFHKLVKLQRAEKNTPTSLLIVDGEELTDPEDICEGFRKHFNNLAVSQDYPNFSAKYKDNANTKVAEIEELSINKQDKIDPVTTEDVLKLTATFKNGKSQDCYDLTAEHLKYAGPNVIECLTNIINYIFETTYIPESLLKGILTPIPKKNKDKKLPDNYRGITVTPILCKLLEKAWLVRANPILSKKQNGMQTGFTQGKSPSNAALLVTESIAEATELKKPLYVTLLDVSKAFDVVDHEILFDELYEAGVDGDLWLMFRQFYHKPVTSIKWGKLLSQDFDIEQGVRQGGVSSAPIYKVFNNRLLNQLSEHHTNHRIGSIKIPVPTCADDSAVLSNSATDAQVALDLVDEYARNHRYKINATKSATISYGSSVQLGLEIGGEEIPYCEESMHLGVCRNTDNKLNVDYRIQLARKTMYALMGAGLHGKNGLAPHVSYHIWTTYAVPRMLYGIDATIIKSSDIAKFESFQRKMLRQFQFLPKAPPPANAAVYGLLGVKPVEAIIDTAMLTLFGNISRDLNSIERELALRQLAVKSFKSKSWFMKIRSILNKYNLMSIFDVVANPPDKNKWKSAITRAIDSYWNDRLQEDATDKSSMNHMNTNEMRVGKTHQVWSTLSTNCREITQAGVKARLLTNTYVLQSNRAKFNQYKVDDTCLLCENEPEDRCHFLLRCSALEAPRTHHLKQLMEIVVNESSAEEASIIVNNQQLTLQLILDCSHPSITSILTMSPTTIDSIERISRKLCYILHRHRSAQIKLLSENNN